MLFPLAGRAVAFLAGAFSGLFLSPGSSFSIASLLSALCVAIVVLLSRRRSGKKPVRYAVMFRALFPRWLHLPSFRADVWFLLLNLLASGILFGWTVISSRWIADGVAAALASLFGAVGGSGVNALTGRIVVTVSLFLAYELGYWIDHYLSHRIGWLWEFHKVHHTAEVLTPITNFRVHPVDSVKFYNILAIVLGTTGGILSYLQLGRPFAVGGSNVILVAFIFVTVHLQHSHVWIAATGPLGRLILSPAHHQIHHSDNPIHFDKNFGACLSIWDWLFGTLHLPERRRERLTFGIATRVPAHHTAKGSLAMPFVLAWERVRPPASSRPERSVSDEVGAAPMRPL